ncbi:AAA domain-containing protein [Bacillus velezensis]|uniref:AAA domain-containing protein n=1 Tax=Bacillus velezensis TaxID=492670 RepID=UPI001C63D8C1|nr:AAA domain-containing protein [Bacillus velezensis]MCX2883433.1 AAA domain-containing protein [Bacillus velezensis]QYJ65159.1 replication ATP-dependent helicase [Bacillus velezensis]
MNGRKDILNAWITIEQLSEGSINKKDKALKPLHTVEEDWNKFFLDFLTKQKEQQNVSDKFFKKSGLVLYFDIFNFQEIVDILREKYKIAKTCEEVSNSDKFTFSVYFDNQLNFIAEKLFYTMSGYIRRHGDLPKDILKVENSFREDLNRKFDEGFNTAFSELLQNYNVTTENFRYAFVKNLDNGDVNLHSFFIGDLNKAKTITNKNLDRYFNGFSGYRKNLDGKKESTHFNSHVFEMILQPKFYPLGRFPSNPDFALSFMQQVAVNLALNDENDIRSVNGPPGTGKTTLLKDIFADLVVQQAAEILQLSDKNIQGSLVYWQSAKLGVLPDSISDKNIIVASSNNGAVQNIVKELPKKEKIADDFQKQLEETNYFKDVSNSKLTGEGFGKNRKIKSELLNEDNWGAFSLEGGASTNINKLLLTIEVIEKDLEENYEASTDVSVYQEFLRLYDEIKTEREKIQEYSEKMYSLQKFKTKHQEQTIAFEQEVTEKRANLISQEEEAQRELERLRQESVNLQKKLSDCSIEIKNLNDLQAQAERNYDVVTSQKPSFLWFQKIFNKSKVEQYFKNLNNTNAHLNHLSQQKTKLLNECMKIENELKVNAVKREYTRQQIQDTKTDFEQWMTTQQNGFKKLEQEIALLEKLKFQSGIEELDFSLSYDELQKSNPWFTKRFRILQSELFISALKVRKQFLYENRKNLRAARIIWSKQSEYIGKENGHQLISESWQWLNFAIPVVSTTFASFGRMFKNLNENSIGNLFIDEAGQALPQASVGAIFRSKKVMVVGDPSQIKPVLTLDSNVLTLIGRYYKVDEKFVSANASTQTIVDAASQYGFQKNEDEWIGIPLWVHRRSNYPMFTISNEISYDGLMVQGKSVDESQGKSQWYDSTGKANDKFVKEQAYLLKSLIDNRLQENPDLAEEIYVISPFRNVAYKLAQVLDEINFTKRENGKKTNIGTVHTFQGKEAKIVYFVLGADTNSSGAARWAVSDPNMMNVAATRAKEEFYVIGDKKLYASLGSEVANKTISIIEDYNR